MKTGQRTAPAIWLWKVVDMRAPRTARVTGFVPGSGARPPAMQLTLPAGWRLGRVAALPPCECGTLSTSTRSILGALTWCEQPLSYAR